MVPSSMVVTTGKLHGTAIIYPRRTAIIPIDMFKMNISSTILSIVPFRNKISVFVCGNSVIVYFIVNFSITHLPNHNYYSTLNIIMVNFILYILHPIHTHI